MFKLTRGVGHCSTTSLRGRSGQYYSPPGTSYTIVERPHSPSYYFNSAPGAVETRSSGKGMATSLPSRASYLASSSSAIPSSGSGGEFAFFASGEEDFLIALSFSPNNSGGARSSGHGNSNHVGGGGSERSAHHHAHHGKGGSGGSASSKRPISPEQVIRLFGTTTASSTSMPTSGSQQYTSNGSRSGGERGRRSPASSPPSMTHQLYRERERDRSVPNIHELSTRTVSMSRDQLLEGGQGFGICVKGGRDAGEATRGAVRQMPLAEIGFGRDDDYRRAAR